MRVATSSKSVAKILVCLALLGPSVAGGCGARTGLETGGGNDAGTDRDVETPEPCPDRSVTRLRLGAVQQMDLLFVVDSSVSMADKQALLNDAVPPLVTRLVNPLCVDPFTGIGTATATPADPRPVGSEREFAPLKDLHIGVITTSLGAHGGQVCGSLAPADGTPDDPRAPPAERPRRPLELSEPRVPLLGSQGRSRASGRNRLAAPGDGLRLHVSAVGDDGCGYEAPLEAPLPVPRRSLSSGFSRNRQLSRSGTGCTQRVGVDETVLAQRKAFLRPDSVVAILMLSDENDCSIVDAGQGFLVGTLFNNGGNPFQMPRSTSTCATDSNSACCRTCGTYETTPPQAACRSPRTPSVSEAPGSESPRIAATFAAGIEAALRHRSPLPHRPLRRRTERAHDLPGVDLPRRRLSRAATPAGRRWTRGCPEPPCTTAETGEPVSNRLYSNLTSEPRSRAIRRRCSWPASSVSPGKI